MAGDEAHASVSVNAHHLMLESFDCDAHFMTLPSSIGHNACWRELSLTCRATIAAIRLLLRTRQTHKTDSFELLRTLCRRRCLRDEKESFDQPLRRSLTATPLIVPPRLQSALPVALQDLLGRMRRPSSFSSSSPCSRLELLYGSTMSSVCASNWLSGSASHDWQKHRSHRCWTVVNVL